MIWYLPTYFGDIRLEVDPESPKRTILLASELSSTERDVMDLLKQRAVRPSFLRRPWATEDDFAAAFAGYRVGKALRVTLDAPIEVVSRFMARALKPERRLLAATRIHGGRIEEVWRSSVDLLSPSTATEEAHKEDAAKAATNGKSVEDKVNEASVDDEEDSKPKMPVDPPAVVATVAQPVQGCPAPDFPNAFDARANRVLEAFLSDEQRDDWRRRGRFVSIGMDTGHRYMLTSRDAREALQTYGSRSLYDLDERRAYCVHDWAVPAPEELLALHLFLAIPGGESFLRHVPVVPSPPHGLHAY